MRLVRFVPMTFGLVLVTTAVAFAAPVASTDPRGDVSRRQEGIESTVDEPGVDVLSWGVDQAETGDGSSRVSLRLELAGSPKVEGDYTFLIDGETPGEARWWLRLRNDGAHLLRSGEDNVDGGFWEYGCPGMDSSWGGSVGVVTLDTGCIGAPPDVTLRPLARWSADGLTHYHDYGDTSLPIEFAASGQRLAPALPVDTTRSCRDAPEGSFVDTQGNPHEGSIDCVGHLGISLGKGDGRYAPAERLRRGQIASFVLRTVQAAGIAIPSPEETHDFYPDDDGHIHEYAINALTTMVMFYAEDGTADLDEAVTRIEMAEFVEKAITAVEARARGLAPDYFEDDDHHAGPAEFRANRLAAWGIVAGKSRGRFAPDEGLRRDSMATFLTRLHTILLDAGTRHGSSGWWRH